MVTESLKFFDLRKRIVSALFFTALSTAAISIGGLITAIFLTTCVFVLVWELFNICNEEKFKLFSLQLIIIVLVSVGPLLQFYNYYPIIALLFSSFVSLAFKEGRLIKFLCIIYIGISVFLFQNILLSHSGEDPRLTILLIVLIVVSSDVGGYFFGRVVGGAKILIKVSPKKTWSGSLGGVFLAIIVCISLNQLLNYPTSYIIFLAICLSISAQIGDLFESSIKRYFKVKDSGFLLPGHGGLFDRLDGLLAAIPIYALINTFY